MAQLQAKGKLKRKGLQHKSPKTHNENINKYIHDKIELFNKYKLEIEMINNFTN